jgi:hypothetical protein
MFTVRLGYCSGIGADGVDMAVILQNARTIRLHLRGNIILKEHT